jgi:hypothetical protein
MNKHFFTAVVAAAALLSVAACDNAKSPDAVANDVATARAKSSSDIADAQQKASQETSAAQPTSDGQNVDVKNADAKAVYDVGTTKAEGDHKVALAKCEALSGDHQKTCKDAADAEYNLVKAHAKANLNAAQGH